MSLITLRMIESIRVKTYHLVKPHLHQGFCPCSLGIPGVLASFVRQGGKECLSKHVLIPFSK